MEEMEGGAGRPGRRGQGWGVVNQKEVFLVTAICLNIQDDDGSACIYWGDEGDPSQRDSMSFAGAFSTVKLSHIKLSNEYLVEEQRCRRTVNRKLSIKVNTQARVAVLFSWVLHNPITTATDIFFVHQENVSFAIPALSIVHPKITCSESFLHSILSPGTFQNAFYISLKVDINWSKKH